MKIKTHLKAGDVPYVVQPGDSLWKIAQNQYGPGVNTASAVDYIYAFNKKVIGPNPNLIRPGQVFMIPEPPKVINPQQQLLK